MREIDKIFHIADIHIRNLKRHKEYKKVFKNLYKEIKKRKTEDSLIVVAGDIVHSKTEMSPELVDMVSEFFKNLTNLCDTIVITGNHDCNLNNLYRMDAISPIIENLNIDNLYYHRNSGVYTHGNIDFVVWSVFDKEENFIKASDVKTNNKKVGLYHGPVNKATTDVGYEIFNNKVKVSMMNGYDMFLLGDIHSFQYLNNDKTIAYPSSLIQQNHGESLSGHGMLVWDVESCQSEFVEIENPYGYYTLEVKSGRVPNVDDMPKNPRLRVKITNTDAADVKKVLARIRKRYNVSEFTIIRNDTLSKTKLNDRDVKIHYENVQNVEHQNGLIKDYLTRNYPQVTDDLIQEAQDINRELNLKIKEEETVRNIRWYPKKFEFSNMFSYGENNVIDFSTLDGVNGLFAPNTSGKSSIFDALSFCIFDKCNRTYKADHILNNRKDEFYCEFNFEINGVDYFIKKAGQRQKRGNVRVDVDFFKIEGGERVSLNGEQRRDTTAIIRQYMGSYEDFIFTCLSLQGNNSIFTELSQSERKDLLAQLMGLNIFDKLYNEAQDEIRDNNALVRKFKKKDYSKELSELEKKSDKCKEALKEQKALLSNLNEELLNIDSELEDNYNKLYSVSDDIDIDEYEQRKDNLIEEIKSLKSDISENEEEYKSVKSKILKYNEQIKKYDGIEEEKNEYEKNKSKYESLLNEIEKHKVKVSHTLKRYNSIKESLEMEINEDCDACKHNAKKFNKDYESILDELNEQKSNADTLIQEKEKYKDLFDDSIIEKYNEYVNLKDEIEDLNRGVKYYAWKIDNLKSKIESNEKELNNVVEKIEQYYENEDKIKENKKIREKINVLKSKKNKLNNEKDKEEKSKSDILREFGSVENRIESVNEEIEEGKRLERRLETYEYYIDSVKRDGIPYELISKAIPVIQSEINNILQQIVEFTLNIEVDGKNINAKIVYEDREWPLEMASGMERFISGLAIRVSLMNISNLPRPNFIAIDEGFGSLDSDNFNSLFMLFEYLKTQFEFIIIISHLDTMRDIVSSFIEIEKENGFSKVLHE